MVDSNLRSLGEFEYGAIAHLAVPRGGIVIPGRAAVKLYELRKNEDGSFKRGLHSPVRSLLEKINLGVGMGYAIHSEGVLNISMWGGFAPSVVTPNIFTYENFGDFSLVPVSDAGAYCCWEQGIAAHEASAWRRFLFSKRKEQDKIDYLSNFFYGIIGEREKIQDQPEYLGLSGRARTVFKKLDILTFNDLSRYTESEIRGMVGIGRTTVVQLRHALEDRGLCFKS